MPEDKAWAEFKTPLNKRVLLNFCQDVERLLRINPFLDIKKWEKLSDQHFLFHAINHSQNPAFEITTDLQIQKKTDGLEILYRRGLKSSTAFTIQEITNGSKLTITEKYTGLPEEKRRQKLHKVDKSLNKWAENLQEFLIDWHRWSWFSPWRYYKNRIWLPMRPTARRVTYLILCISFIEIVLIALGSAIYIIEYK